MTDRDKKIMEYMGEPEMLSQLAEECCELAIEAQEKIFYGFADESSELLEKLSLASTKLGKAALKLRRVLDGRNPTPKTEEEARADLIEEVADVYNVLGFLLNAEDNTEVYNIIQRKKDRWLGRLEENSVMADVVAETKQAFGRCDEDWSEGE